LMKITNRFISNDIVANWFDTHCINKIVNIENNYAAWSREKRNKMNENIYKQKHFWWLLAINKRHFIVIPSQTFFECLERRKIRHCHDSHTSFMFLMICGKHFGRISFPRDELTEKRIFWQKF
jgi:hypothetical protein